MGILHRFRCFRRVAGAVLLIQGAAYCGMAMAAPPAPDVWIDELVLEVVKKPYRVSEAMIVVQQGNKFYLPLMETAVLLGFVAEGDAARGTVNGWAGTEDHSYTVDVTHGEYSVRGGKQRLSPDDVIMADEYQGAGDDVFIALDIAAALWPASFSVDFSALQLAVDSEAPLPFEARLERTQRQAQAAARRQYRDEPRPDLPMIDHPYKMLSAPAVDLDASYRWAEETGAVRGVNSVTGRMDLLGMAADFTAVTAYENGGLREPENIRLTGRRYAEPGDDLFLGFRAAEVGDARYTPRSLIDTSLAGRGFVLSSRAADNAQAFDRIVVDGRGSPGWEVELYRNNELLDFGRVDSGGEYRFENVQLMTGNNNIRVILYGPQGQVEERSRNYAIGNGMVGRGQVSYDVGVIDVDRDFIPVHQDPRQGPRGVASNAYVAYGAGDGLTLFGAATRLPVGAAQGRWRNYISGGAMFGALGGLAQVELYRETAGGHAAEARFAGPFLGLNLNARQAVYRDFESPDAGFDGGAKRAETDVTLNHTLRLPFGALGLQVGGRHYTLADGPSITELTTRQSLSHGGVRLTHQTRTSLEGGHHDESTGLLSISTRMRGVNIRGSLGYGIHPQFRAESLMTDAYYTDPGGLTVGARAGYDMADDVESLGATVGYDFRRFLASLEGDWFSDRGVELVLRASTALAPYAVDGGYIMSSRKLTGVQPVRGRVFLDNDGDGLFSEGDAPQPEARILVGARASEETANAEGYVMALHRGRRQEVSVVQVDSASLEDPYLVPGGEGYNTMTRPGSIVDVDLPVVETGGIDGTVSHADGRPMRGATVELVDAAGAVVMTTQAAHDGFYTFDFVRRGDYAVRVAGMPPVAVMLTQDNLFAEDVDLRAKVKEVMGPSVPPATLPAAIVRGVRMGAHPGFVRMVLDISGPLDYAVAPDAEGVIVNLPAAGWEAPASWREDSGRIVRGYMAETLAGGGVRLRIEGRKAMIVAAQGRLTPGDGYGHRIFMDLREAP